MCLRFLFLRVPLLLIFVGLCAVGRATTRDFSPSVTDLSFSTWGVALQQTSAFSIYGHLPVFDPTTVEVSDDADWLEATLDTATRLVSVKVDAEFGIPIVPATLQSRATITLRNASGAVNVVVALNWIELSQVQQVFPPDPETGRFIVITSNAMLVFDADAQPLAGWRSPAGRFIPPSPGSSIWQGITYDKRWVTVDLATLTMKTSAFSSALATITASTNIVDVLPGPDGLLYIRTYAEPAILRAYDPVRHEMIGPHEIPALSGVPGLTCRFASAPFGPRLDIALGAVRSGPRHVLGSLSMRQTEAGTWEFGPLETVALPPAAATLGSNHSFLSNPEGTVFANGYALWRETADGPRLLRHFDTAADSLVRAISPDGHFYATNRSVRATEDDHLVFALPRIGYYPRLPSVRAFTADGRALIVTTSENWGPILIPIIDPAARPSAPLRTPAAGEILREGDRLRWGAVPGASAYRVHLGPDETDELPLLHTTTDTDMRPVGLAPGRLHRWRVDAVFDGVPVRGTEQTFHTRAVALAGLPAAFGVLPGLATQSLRLTVHAATAETAWRLAVDQPWATVSPAVGEGSAPVTLTVNASAIRNGDAPRIVRVRLVADGAEEAHEIAVAPVAPDFVTLQLIPGTGRGLALNRVAGAANQLVEVDFATGTLLRGVTVGEAETFTVSADGTQAYILDHVANEIVRWTLPGLTPATGSIALPYPARAGPFAPDAASARRLGPAGPGRFAIYQDQLSQILGIEGEVLAEHTTYLRAQRYSDDGQVVFFASSFEYGDWEIRRGASFDSSVAEIKHLLGPRPSGPNPLPVLLSSADGSRAYFGGFVFGPDLAPIAVPGATRSWRSRPTIPCSLAVISPTAPARPPARSCSRPTARPPCSRPPRACSVSSPRGAIWTSSGSTPCHPRPVRASACSPSKATGSLSW
jgi:hypothetical protein